MWHGGWGGGMMLGWIIGLVVLVLLILLVVRLTAGTSTAAGRGSPGSEESAQEILKQRYARGEIDEQQYRQMRDELGDD
jgi:putative membrane protein